MSNSVFKMTINAPVEKTWDVLFNQYGDIHVHNPGMIASNYENGATHGALNCARHCQFDEKLWLKETITKVDENRSITVTSTEHNLPMMKDLAATYELTPIGSGKTEVTMTSIASTSPKFMIHLVKGILGKGLVKHLFGMKYYLETGKTVNKENYKQVYKNYN